jgi:L-gulonolactone oxidase
MHTTSTGFGLKTGYDTLQLEPLFKRNVTFVMESEANNLTEMVAVWGKKHEFGDILWLSGQGNGVNNNLGFRPIPKVDGTHVREQGSCSSVHSIVIQLIAAHIYMTSQFAELSNQRRRTCREEHLQKLGSDEALCRVSRVLPTVFKQQGFSFTNDGESFTGYPVMGYQHCIQSLRHLHETTSVREVLGLRDHHPEAFCDLDMHEGVLFHYIKGSTAYLNRQDRRLGRP